jgi:hypothetical protein
LEQARCQGVEICSQLRTLDFEFLFEQGRHHIECALPIEGGQKGGARIIARVQLTAMQRQYDRSFALAELLEGDMGRQGEFFESIDHVSPPDSKPKLDG